jgi:hypothetical protein
VRSPDLEAGDLVVTTHMPNAMDGLRVEIVGAVEDRDDVAAAGLPDAAEAGR